MSSGECRQTATIDRITVGKTRWLHGACAICALAAGCAGNQTVDFSSGHVTDVVAVEASPPVVAETPAVPTPTEAPPVETYTVVVKAVPVIDLLFSLARDANLNVDIQSTIEKTVTLNAVDRPLQEILSRVANQAGLRYRLQGTNLIIEDDLPYWHNYFVDYVNIARTSEGEVGVATQIATSGGTVGEGGGQQGGDEGNLSKTTVKNTSKNDFWNTLQASLTSILYGIDANPLLQDHDPVIANPMSSTVMVLGTQSQHKLIQDYLNQIVASAQRQVLIEMTIVEVELSDNYQAGVDWQRLSDNGGVGDNGVSIQSDFLGSNLEVPPVFSLGYNNNDPSGSSISATVRLLQQFGNTKVLSSPKIMTLNNQTALLKVVNEEVYFTVDLDIRDATADIPERRTFTSKIHTVPVGLVMSVTPQISASGFVSLNIRPTISRITGFAVDPAPRLAGAGFDNLIPEIQVREIESLLQVLDGRTVILGGLMQNETVSSKDGVPGLSRIPGIGKLFSYSRDNLVKTELVIFLKPTIVHNGTAPADSAAIGDFYDLPDGQDDSDRIAYR